MKLNTKNRNVLLEIFENPTKRNILWVDIEVLLRAVGAEVSYGKGARVRVYLNGVKATFHTPHSQKEAAPPLVKYVRRFLIEAGITPEVIEETGAE